MVHPPRFSGLGELFTTWNSLAGWPHRIYTDTAYNIYNTAFPFYVMVPNCYGSTLSSVSFAWTRILTGSAVVMLISTAAQQCPRGREAAGGENDNMLISGVIWFSDCSSTFCGCAPITSFSARLLNGSAP